MLSLVVGEQLPNGSVSQGLHRENSVLRTEMSHTQAMGALVVCVIKQFDPGSKAWGEMNTFPFLSQDTILFLVFFYYRSNSQCMFLAATMVLSPFLSRKR